jgi:hypothetical protein
MSKTEDHRWDLSEDEDGMTPKANPNFWPVREYMVWFANRC